MSLHLLVVLHGLFLLLLHHVDTPISGQNIIRHEIGRGDESGVNFENCCADGHNGGTSENGVVFATDGIESLNRNGDARRGHYCRYVYYQV